MTKRPTIAVQICALILCYAMTTIVCGLLFALIINAPPFSAVTILFYRGVAALAATGFILAAGLIAAAKFWPSIPLGPRDFLSAAIVAVALNLCVFVLGPVTVDRSISVFMLARFDAADHPLGEREVTDDFLRYYGEEWNQVGRRLKEQTASGNLEPTLDGYRLTAQGKAFMKVARLMARVFATDPRFVGLDQK